MSRYDDLEPWDVSDHSRSDSEDSHNSPVDDIINDPTVEHNVEVESTTRTTRQSGNRVDPIVDPAEAGTSRETQESESTVSNAIMNGDGQQDPNLVAAGQIKSALDTMSESFKTLCDQTKQNNKSFIQDLPFFGILKESDSRKNIIPLNECTRFLQIINTQTDNQDFTEAGKISV